MSNLEKKLGIYYKPDENNENIKYAVIEFRSTEDFNQVVEDVALARNYQEWLFVGSDYQKNEVSKENFLLTVLIKLFRELAEDAEKKRVSYEYLQDYPEHPRY